MATLPTPACESGFTRDQVATLVPDLTAFDHWMRGQTQCICEGRAFNHETRTYHEKCGGVAHGCVTYTWDLDRYLGMLDRRDAKARG